MRTARSRGNPRPALRTVGIVGLGLIGGSLAKALRPRVPKLIGVDPVVRAPDLVESGGLEECDLVVLALPMDKIPGEIARVARSLKPGATLMDVASLKGEVFRALQRLERPVNYVSGHPMAGSEHQGFEHSDPRLFQRRPFLLIPGLISGKAPILLAEEMVRAVGAEPVWIANAREHDRAVAVFSQAPHVLAYALLGAAALIGRPEKFAGPSFRDATRVALSDPGTVASYLMGNRRNVLAALADVNRAESKIRRFLLRRDLKGLARHLYSYNRVR